MPYVPFLLTPEVKLILQQVIDCHILPGFVVHASSSSCSEPPQVRPRGMDLIIIIVFIFICLSRRGHTLYFTCGRQRTTHGSRFSPSTLWGLGIELC